MAQRGAEHEVKAPPAKPGWLARTRRARLGVLLALLAAALAVRAADIGGLLALLDGPPELLPGKLELAHGVTVEAVRLVKTPANLVVARVPRNAKLRLRTVLLDDAKQELLEVGPVARRLGALVAVNGDYHRLGPPCFATTFATLVDDGRARVVAAPFDYGAAFWVDVDGAPHVGRLDVRQTVVFPDGRVLPVEQNAETGAARLITRPAAGAWSHPGLKGVPVRAHAGEGGDAWEVTGPVAERFEGPALVASDPAALAGAVPGATLRTKLEGEHAARVRHAIGTGPRLVEAGKVPQTLTTNPGGPQWLNRAFRTAAGLTPTHLLLVVTPQLPRSGISLPALGEALVALGCTDAVNLDGGPSSVLWADGAARSLDGERGGAEPRVASALLVLPPADDDPGLR